MPGVSIFDWFDVFIIPFLCIAGFVFWIIIYATRGEDND